MCTEIAGVNSDVKLTLFKQKPGHQAYTLENRPHGSTFNYATLPLRLHQSRNGDSGRDDAAGADLAGRFAVMLAGVADGLPPARAAVRSEIAAKWACVARHGAIGIVTLRTPKVTVLPWVSAIASYRSGTMGLVDADGARSRFLPAPVLTLDTPAARAALAAAGRDLEVEETRASAGTPQHFDLPGTLRIRYHARARDVVSANIIGRIEGADPRLAREAVVISAHLDHLGVDGRGAIRNGAISNSMPSSLGHPSHPQAMNRVAVSCAAAWFSMAHTSSAFQEEGLLRS